MTAPLRKPVPETVIERFKTYHATHNGWGSMHLVLGNENVKDCHVKHCQEHAAKHGDREAYELCDHLMAMSKSQRIKMSRMVV